MALLSIVHLTIEYPGEAGWLRMVDDASFAVEPGEILALVGERGSGKSLACRAILRLLPGRHGRVASGRIAFADRDISGLPDRELISYRGRHIAMVFQDPDSFFDPTMPIGAQLTEPLQFHDGITRIAARQRATELLQRVGIVDTLGCLESYPRDLPLGLRWRAMIAAGISREPRLLIVDQPVGGLELTVQAQVVRLLLDLRDRSGMAMILVARDLGPLAQIADSVAVMYAGRIVERAPKSELLRHPLHPYSEGLLRARPDANPSGGQLPELQGEPPSPANLPAGCRFHPRCPLADEACRFGDVQLTEISSWRATACRHWDRIPR
jgi:peptide/nickel transport system ATP-binding protein